MPYKDPIKQKEAVHKEYILHKDKHIKRANKRRDAIREWFRTEILPQYSCVRCGEDDSSCLDFHHLDPATKDKAVSTLVGNGHTKEYILNEVKKCVVFCANCHRKFHAGRFELEGDVGAAPTSSASKAEAIAESLIPY